MSLTNSEIFKRYSQVDSFTRVEVKRRLAVTELFPTELVTNGDFTTDTDWTKGVGWTIAGGTANASGSNENLSQDAGLISGFFYQVTFLLTEYQAGTLNIAIGSDGLSTDISQDGIYTIKIRALGDSVLYFKGSNSFTGKIDNVSLKLVKQYEDTWYDITGFLLSDSVSPVNISIPDNLYEFGEVRLSSASFKLKNIHGEVSDETNINSIFFNHIRHNSLVRIVKGYIDKYTDPVNPVQVDSEIFQGLIDDKSAKTNNDDTESFTAKGLDSILSSVTVSELGTLTATNVNDLVYEILNRGQFLLFFNIKTENIDAGYNTTNLNLSLIEQDLKVIDLLKKLAFGHSVFYVENGEFYFSPAKSSSVVKHEFLNTPERKIAVYDFNQGSKNVIEKWFWDETALSYISESERFGTSKTIDDLPFIDNATQQQNLLDFIGSQTDIPRLTFKIDLPFYPSARIFDLIRVRRQEILGDKGGFVLDESKLDEGILGRVVGAIKISQKELYFITGVRVSREKTTITAQAVNPVDVPVLSTNISDMVLGCSLSLVKKGYASDDLTLRRNDSTDTAVDAGANDTLNVGFRNKILDTYILEKWLNPNDFINDVGENASSDTGYINIFYEQSGNGYNIIQGTTSRQPKYNPSTNGIIFDGVSDWLNRAAITELSKDNSYSVFLKFKVDSVSVEQSLMQQYISATDIFSAHVNSSGVLSVSINDGSFYSASGNIEIGEHCFICVWDAVNKTVKLYIDGVLQTGTIDASLPDTSGLRLGAGLLSVPSDYFGGEIYHTLVFGKIINTAEIETLNLFAEQTNV
jgi:hypothetical protein